MRTTPLVGFAFLMLTYGCAGTMHGGADLGSGPALRLAAEQAFALGVKSLTRQPMTLVDTAWVLQQIVSSTPDADLQRLVDSMMLPLATDPFLPLINPAAARAAVPEDPGRGIARLGNYVLAAVGTPADRAISFLRDYLAREETGYILTHQLLVLAWSKQTGLTLPAELTIKKQRLLDKITAEQRAVTTFSDLYAERAAVLLLFGKPSPSDAALWAQRVVESQRQDGSWEVAPWKVSYDGESLTIANPTHTQVLALLILRMYLDKY